MTIRLNGQFSNTSGSRIAVRCPHCRNNGIIESLGSDIRNSQLVLGLYRCPNENCIGLLFFITSIIKGELILTYPN